MKNVFFIALLVFFGISDVVAEEIISQLTGSQNKENNSDIEYRDFPYTLKSKETIQDSYDIKTYQFKQFDLDKKDDLMAAYLEAGDLEAAGKELEQNLDKAIFWYKKSAELGSLVAMHRIAEFHHFGVGGSSSSRNEGISWYIQAATGGYVPSMVNLATIAFEDNKPNDAKTWLMSAAKAGDERSMLTLADLFFTGADAFPQDFTKAASYYEMAAIKGFPAAQLRLGILLAKGIGTEKDLVSSYKWLSLAANNGISASKDYLKNTLLSQLSNDEIIAGDKLVAEFKVN